MTHLNKVLHNLKKFFCSIFSRRTLIVLIITLVLLEVTLDIWISRFADLDNFMSYATIEETIARRKPRFEKHHYLNYALSPNYNREGTHHNKYGFREPDFKMKKPKGIYRIATLGGSTTYTEFVKKDRDTYPARLEVELKRLGYTNVEVINAGGPGYTSWESLVNLEFRVLDADPDMLIIYQNVNDIHARLVDPALYRGDNSGYRKPWVTPAMSWYEHIAVVRVILRLIGRSHNVHGIQSMTKRDNPYRDALKTQAQKENLLKKNKPLYYRRNIENMIGIARIHGIDVMLATWAYNGKKSDYISEQYYQSGVAEHNKILKNIGKNHNVPVYDFAKEMPGASCPDCWHDGRHVTRKGAKIKAKLFARYIDRAGLIR